MGAELPVFTEEEMAIDETNGFPKAYALLCRTSATNGPFAQGPPLSFIPYALKSHQALRVKELDQMFPAINPQACSSKNPRIYANFLWKRLDHLGNAGFDPDLFRVDCFGNVVYRHADPASPLAWDIDHLFPCSRGGKTTACNLRIVQWQVCKKKKNQLDFLIPWWDLQLGISVNQFLSIFASKNSDFRNRAFSLLFPDGGGKELNCLQNLNFHSFPQNFMEAKRKQGLAPAAIVLSHNSSETMALKAVDLNNSLIHKSPFPALKKSFQKDVGNPELQNFKSNMSKENNQSAIYHHENNPYRTISCERHLQRQRKEARKLQAEISQLDEELNEIKQLNDTKRIELQELEAVLTKRRRRVEKCRRLAEAQASYRSLLEKMIKDIMHQTVVYKEQLKVNQAASSVLMARLEAEKAACDSSENEVRRKYKQRDELEMHNKQVSHGSRKYDDFHENSNPLSSIRRARRPIKELREFLEEEHRAFLAGISLDFDGHEESEETECSDNQEENEEFRNQVGERNVEKWLQILLGNSKEGSPYSDSDRTQRSFNETETDSREKDYSDKCMIGTNSSACKVACKGRKSFGGYDKEDSKPSLRKSKSLRGFIPFPSSLSITSGMKNSAFPSSLSIASGMKKSVYCMSRGEHMVMKDKTPFKFVHMSINQTIQGLESGGSGSQFGGAPFHAAPGPPRPEYDAARSTGYDAPRSMGYDTSAAPHYETPREPSYEPPRGLSYDATRGPGYEARSMTGGAQGAAAATANPVPHMMAQMQTPYGSSQVPAAYGTHLQAAYGTPQTSNRSSAGYEPPGRSAATGGGGAN